MMEAAVEFQSRRALALGLPFDARWLPCRRSQRDCPPWSDFTRSLGRWQASRLARLLVSSLCLLSLGATAAAERVADSPSAEILQQQQQLDRRLAAELQDCRSRFAVSDCVAAAKLRHRSAVKPLRDRLMQLDDEERQRKAAARRTAIDDKARAATAPDPAPAPPTDLRLRKSREPLAPRRAPPEALLPASPVASSPASDAAVRDAAALKSGRERAEPRDPQNLPGRRRERDDQRAADAAAAARRVQAAQARAVEAEAVKARIAERQAERARRAGEAALPLPIPSVIPAASAGLPGS